MMVRDAGDSCQTAGVAVQQGISGLRVEVSWVHPVVQTADTPLQWMGFSLVRFTVAS